MSHKPVAIFATACALVFAASAAVQLNDPDPARWIALYGAAALVSLATAFRRAPAALHLGIAAVAGIWALTLIPTVFRERAFSGNEVERELGGLALVALAMAILRRTTRRGTDAVVD